MSSVDRWYPPFCTDRSCRELSHVTHFEKGDKHRLHKNVLHIQIQKKPDGTFEIIARCYTKNIHQLQTLLGWVHSIPPVSINPSRGFLMMRGLALPQPRIKRQSQYQVGSERYELSERAKTALQKRIRDESTQLEDNLILPKVLMGIVTAYAGRVLENLHIALWAHRYSIITKNGKCLPPKSGVQIIEEELLGPV